MQQPSLWPVPLGKEVAKSPAEYTTSVPLAEPVKYKLHNIQEPDTGFAINPAGKSTGLSIARGPTPKARTSKVVHMSTTPIPANSFPGGSQDANVALSQINSGTNTIIAKHPYNRRLESTVIPGLQNDTISLETQLLAALSHQAPVLQDAPNQGVVPIIVRTTPSFPLLSSQGQTIPITQTPSAAAPQGTLIEKTTRIDIPRTPAQSTFTSGLPPANDRNTSGQLNFANQDSLVHKLWWNLLSKDQRAIFYPFIIYLPDQFHSLCPFSTELFDENRVSRQDGTRIGRFRREDGEYEYWNEPIPPKKYFRKFIYNQDVTLEHPENFVIKKEEDKNPTKDIKLFFHIKTRKCPVGWDYEKSKDDSYDYDHKINPTLWVYTMSVEVELNHRTQWLKRIIRTDHCLGQDPPSWEDSIKVLKAELWNWMNSLVQQHHQNAHVQRLNAGVQHYSQKGNSNVPLQSPAPRLSGQFPRPANRQGGMPPSSAARPVPFNASKGQTDPQMTPTTSRRVLYNSPYNKQPAQLEQKSTPGLRTQTPDAAAIQNTQNQNSTAIPFKQARKLSVGASRRGSKSAIPNDSEVIDIGSEQGNKRKSYHLQDNMSSVHSAKRHALSNQASKVLTTPGQQTSTQPITQNPDVKVYHNGPVAKHINSNVRTWPTQTTYPGNTKHDQMQRNETVENRLKAIGQELSYLRSQSTEQTKENFERQRKLDAEGYYLQQSQKQIYRSLDSFNQDVRRILETTQGMQPPQDATQDQMDQFTGASSVILSGVAQQVLRNPSYLGNPKMNEQQMKPLNRDPSPIRQQQEMGRIEITPGDYPPPEQQQIGQIASSHTHTSVRHLSEGSGQSVHSQSLQESGVIHHSSQAAPPTTLKKNLPNLNRQGQYSPIIQQNPDHQGQQLMYSVPPQRPLNLPGQHHARIHDHVSMNGTASQHYHYTPQQMANDYNRLYRCKSQNSGQSPYIQQQRTSTDPLQNSSSAQGSGPSRNRVFGDPVSSGKIGSSGPGHHHQASLRNLGNHGISHVDEDALPIQTSAFNLPNSHAHGQSFNMAVPNQTSEQVQLEHLRTTNNVAFQRASNHIFQNYKTSFLHGQKNTTHKTQSQYFGQKGQLNLPEQAAE